MKACVKVSVLLRIAILFLLKSEEFQIPACSDSNRQPIRSDSAHSFVELATLSRRPKSGSEVTAGGILSIPPRTKLAISFSALIH
jgi:hypothetical protein